MKFLVVLFASVALSAGSAIPVVPGDNSHYVEGVSRYIWMPDGDGNPHLVDLLAPVDEESLKTTDRAARNEYWLFTRRNPNNAQILRYGDANAIRNSNYNGNRPTKLIAHGWNSDGNTNMNPLITAAFLRVADVNVIILDWRHGSSGLYSTVVRNIPDVGRHVANFLNFLFRTAGGNWNNVHLLGHSLGAHVVAVTGRAGRPARVTGLDPAGPQFHNNPIALNRYCGLYVEIIHTDGGLLGIMDPSGHTDFYPNGGTHAQPGCNNSLCSHRRAPLFFASSITSNHLVGRQCANFQQATNNQCTGVPLVLGTANLNKRGVGLYGLSTGSSHPF